MENYNENENEESETKNFKILKEQILKISQSQNWESAKNEWALFDMYQSDTPKTCLCGHKPITNICIIINNKTGAKTEVGTTCLENFLYTDTISLEFKEIKRRSKYADKIQDQIEVDIPTTFTIRHSNTTKIELDQKTRESLALRKSLTEETIDYLAEMMIITAKEERFLYNTRRILYEYLTPEQQRIRTYINKKALNATKYPENELIKAEKINPSENFEIAKSFAEGLDRIWYGDLARDEIETLAKQNKLIVMWFFEDNAICFTGMIKDDIGHWSTTPPKDVTLWLFYLDEDNYEISKNKISYSRTLKIKHKLDSICNYFYETDIRHATFSILDDENLPTDQGIVFHVSEIMSMA